MIFSAALVYLGFVLIAFGAVAIGDRKDPTTQVPYLVSAGISGLALIGLGAGLVAVLVLRTIGSPARQAIAELIDALAAAR